MDKPDLILEDLKTLISEILEILMISSKISSKEDLEMMT
eukprot:CAMPEP_0205849260 /NCGR_PEP_ID=MMETSP1019-20131125/5401_1 /ASSEMBLY_ACC=CAM_ASM_000403 /TAXON_ID=46462 /ORGANISM="Anophryoides haemophila, Strain AH6" /LENGTH=38 /DNA_ID= /DNA_START= /DNA_END= /DNA_ORIENTATION=